MSKKVVKSTKWKSGLKVVVPEVFLSEGLEELFAEIQSRMVKQFHEFSVLLKGDWDEDFGGFYISKEYYIPLQEVTGASVDYYVSFDTEAECDEALAIFKDLGMEVIKGSHMDGDIITFHIEENLHKLRKDGYNVIAHSHPFSSSDASFSSADHEYINSHFPCSILLNKESEVSKASLLLPTTQKSLKIRIITDEITPLIKVRPKITVDGMDKITEKPIPTRIVKSGRKEETPYGSHKRKNSDYAQKLLGEGNTDIMKLGEIIKEVGDAYIGDGLWRSDVEREIKLLVNTGHDEEEVRKWYAFYLNGGALEAEGVVT